MYIYQIWETRQKYVCVRLVLLNSSFMEPTKIKARVIFISGPLKSKPIFSVFSPGKKKAAYFVTGACSPAQHHRRRWRTSVPFLQPVSSPGTMSVRLPFFVSPANLHPLAVSISVSIVWKVVSPGKWLLSARAFAGWAPQVHWVFGHSLFVLLTCCVSSCKPL